MAKTKRQHVGSGTTWEKLAGYARAVRVGDRILVSGTTATDEQGAVVGAGDVEVQTDFILRKIETAVSQLGGSMNDIVRTRIYLRNVDDWEPAARVHGQWFGDVLPANTLVEAKLVGDDYLVEIEAEAIVSYQ